MNATPGNNNSSRKTKKDAFQQPNIENSSPANPKVSINITEKRENTP